MSAKYKEALNKLSVTALKKLIRTYMSHVKIVMSGKKKAELIDHIVKHTEFKEGKISLKNDVDFDIPKGATKKTPVKKTPVKKTPPKQINEVMKRPQDIEPPKKEPPKKEPNAQAVKILREVNMVNDYLYKNIGTRKGQLSSEKLQKLSDFIDISKAFDLYPTNKKWGQIIKDDIKDETPNIIDWGAGLLGLSELFIADYNNYGKIILIEMIKKLVDEIKPIEKLSDSIKIINEDIMKLKESDIKINDKFSLVNISNPPFEVYIPQLQKRNKNGYLWILLRILDITSKLSKYEKILYFICPKTFFHSNEKERKDKWNMIYDNKIPKAFFKEYQKVYGDSDYIDDDDLSGLQIEIYKEDVNDFMKFAKNGRPTKLGLSCGLFRIIYF